MGYSSAEVHDFLTTAFSDEELERLVYDYFRDAQAELSSGMSQAEKAQRLIEFCQRRSLVRPLFAALRNENPNAFRETFGEALPDDLDQRFLGAVPGGAAHKALEQYRDFFEKSRLLQERGLRSLLPVVGGLAGIGLLVFVSALLPTLFSKVEYMRLPASVGGLFLSAIGFWQYNWQSTSPKNIIRICEQAQLTLGKLDAAYQAGDVPGSKRWEDEVETLVEAVNLGGVTYVRTRDAIGFRAGAG